MWTIYHIYKYVKEGKKGGDKRKVPMVGSKQWKKIHVREILEKYVDLENSCLTDTEKKQVMDILYKYKEAFSLRDEIGTCPNREVEIDMTDKSPFFIRPFHVKEEDKIL